MDSMTLFIASLAVSCIGALASVLLIKADNAAKTAGNCIVDDHAILGSGVIVKHGCRVGSWALVKDGCRANKDVPPYIVAAHNPIAYYGVNAFILRKEQKLSEEIIDDIASKRKVFRTAVP